jgi:membrane-associated phospholipid phosphatase
MSSPTLSDAWRFFHLWYRLLGIAILAMLLAILFLDGPIAHFFGREIHMAALKPYAPSSHLISITILAGGASIGLFCLVTRHFPRLAEAMLLSAVAAVASIHLADLAKRLAAHPGPGRFVHYLRDHFGWHNQAIGLGGFPSTHAAIAAAGLSVMAFYFPRARSACLLGGLAIDLLLVAGGWHFISDVLAGNILGFTIAAGACGVVAAFKVQRLARLRVT